MATDQIPILLKGNILGMVANVITNSILIPVLGYLGATVATVIAQCLMIVYQYYHMNKQIGVMSVILRQVKYLLYGGLMFVAVWLAGRNQDASVAVTIGQIVVGMAVYFVILLLVRDRQMKELTGQVMGTIRGILRSKKNK